MNFSMATPIRCNVNVVFECKIAKQPIWNGSLNFPIFVLLGCIFELCNMECLTAAMSTASMELMSANRVNSIRSYTTSRVTYCNFQSHLQLTVL